MSSHNIAKEEKKSHTFGTIGQKVTCCTNMNKGINREGINNILFVFEEDCHLGKLI